MRPFASGATRAPGDRGLALVGTRPTCIDDHSNRTRSPWNERLGSHGYALYIQFMMRRRILPDKELSFLREIMMVGWAGSLRSGRSSMGAPVFAMLKIAFMTAS